MSHCVRKSICDSPLKIVSSKTFPGSLSESRQGILFLLRTTCKVRKLAPLLRPKQRQRSSYSEPSYLKRAYFLENLFNGTQKLSGFLEKCFGKWLNVFAMAKFRKFWCFWFKIYAEWICHYGGSDSDLPRSPKKYNFLWTSLGTSRWLWYKWYPVSMNQDRRSD